jgi:hypothetical protein
MTSDVLDLLDALVRIDSSNPSLSAGAPGESAIAAHVAEWAAAASHVSDGLVGGGPAGRTQKVISI